MGERPENLPTAADYAMLATSRVERLADRQQGRIDSLESRVSDLEWRLNQIELRLPQLRELDGDGPSW